MNTFKMLLLSAVVVLGCMNDTLYSCCNKPGCSHIQAATSLPAPTITSAPITKPEAKKADVSAFTRWTGMVPSHFISQTIATTVLQQGLAYMMNKLLTTHRPHTHSDHEALKLCLAGHNHEIACLCDEAEQGSDEEKSAIKSKIATLRAERRDITKKLLAKNLAPAACCSGHKH